MTELWTISFSFSIFSLSKDSFDAILFRQRKSGTGAQFKALLSKLPLQFVALHIFRNTDGGSGEAF